MSLLLIATLSAWGSLSTLEAPPPQSELPVIKIKRKDTNAVVPLYAFVDERGEIEIDCDCVTPPDDDGTFVIEAAPDQALTVLLYDAYDADATVWTASAWHFDGTEQVVWKDDADFVYAGFYESTAFALDLTFTSSAGEVKKKKIYIKVKPVSSTH